MAHRRVAGAFGQREVDLNDKVEIVVRGSYDGGQFRNARFVLCLLDEAEAVRQMAVAPSWEDAAEYLRKHTELSLPPGMSSWQDVLSGVPGSVHVPHEAAFRYGSPQVFEGDGDLGFYWDIFFGSLSRSLAPPSDEAPSLTDTHAVGDGMTQEEKAAQVGARQDAERAKRRETDPELQ